MTAKEYLSQAYWLDKRINSKLNMVASLRETATKTTGVMHDDVVSHTRNVHSMQDVIVKIIEIERELDADIDRLVDLKHDMLMDYPHDVTVQIDGMAASAASVIAMAGTHVQMSPTSMMMIHNPFTVAMGDSDEMRHAIQLLDEVKEGIINAYEIKTGLSRVKLAHLMDSETWMSAHKAKELGFCDEVLYSPEDEPDNASGFSFARKSAVTALMNRVMARVPDEPAPEEKPAPPEPDWHMTKLNLLKYL